MGNRRKKRTVPEPTEIIQCEKKKRDKKFSRGPQKKVPLHQYGIKGQLIRVLDANLRPLNKMKRQEIDLIEFIKSLKEKNVKCLELNNYTKVMNLFLHLEEYQMNIDIQEYDVSGQTLKKSPVDRLLLELEVPGLAEHRPSVMVGDKVYVQEEKPDNYVMFEGIVHKVLRDSVLLGFHTRFLASFLRGQTFYVEFDFNRYCLRLEHRAAEIAEKHMISQFFFPSGYIRRKWDINTNFNWFNKKIQTNNEQMQAVSCILNRSSIPHPYLIFGPPGTGKTMTIVEAIKQIHLITDAKILICTPSNDAANEITNRLTDTISKTDLLRYFSPRFNYEDLPENIRKYANYNENGMHYFPTVNEMKKYRIVICTLITAGRLVTYGIPCDHFNYVIIDESGHATESETLVPIAGLISSIQWPKILFAQIVLAGDPQQLGPIIHSKLAKEMGFGLSMLERLITTNETYQKDNVHGYDPMFLTKLLKNYRSHSAILKCPNEMFYQGDLIAKADGLTELFINWEQLPNSKFPMIFHNVVGTDEREHGSPSFFNKKEIDVIMNYLETLLNKKFRGRRIKQEEIGIITPYRKQVEKIRNACIKKRCEKITVGTVEQFQGQERLIIIISTVRSQQSYLKFDQKFHLGFLCNWKRLNVAITRAKSLLIIIGNSNTLQYDENWKKIINYCEENKAITGDKSEKGEEADSGNISDSVLLDDIGEVSDFSRCNA